MRSTMWVVTRQLLLDVFTSTMALVGVAVVLLITIANVATGGPARVFAGFGFLTLLAASPNLTGSHRSIKWHSVGVTRSVILRSQFLVAAIFATFAGVLMAAFGQHQATSLLKAFSVSPDDGTTSSLAPAMSEQWPTTVAAYVALVFTAQVFMLLVVPQLDSNRRRNQVAVCVTAFSAVGLYWLVAQQVNELVAMILVAFLTVALGWYVNRPEMSALTRQPRSPKAEPEGFTTPPWWFTGSTKMVLISWLVFIAVIPVAMWMEQGPNNGMYGQHSYWTVLAMVAIGMGFIVTHFTIGCGRTIAIAAGRTKKHVTQHHLRDLALVASGVFLITCATASFAPVFTVYLPVGLVLTVFGAGCFAAVLYVRFDAENTGFKMALGPISCIGCPIAALITGVTADLPDIAGMIIAGQAVVAPLMAGWFIWLNQRRELIVPKVVDIWSGQ